MNQPFAIRKAQRQKARLRLGIMAPAGAGKTMGALLIAYGMLRQQYPDLPDDKIWAKICLIDSEEGSGELYAGTTKHGVTIGEYGYGRLSAPFTIANYLASQKLAETWGFEVIIKDSITHAWAGTGGILEKQGKIADASKNSYTAWRFVTPEHTSFVDSMLHSPAHIIATMRSKTEYVQEKDSTGKTIIRKIGLAPVQREGMEFEFTVVLDINFESVARATKDRTDLFSTVDGAGRLEKFEFMITPAVGAELQKWLDTGIETLEGVCQRLAAEIAVSINLDNTYQQNMEAIARVDRERPEWSGYITQLFEYRSSELKGS